MEKLTTLALAAGAALILGGSYLLDGPSEADIAAAMVADLEDAKLAAQRFERDYRACMKAMGPDADLIQIAGTDDYVCRKIDTVPMHVNLRAKQ